MVGPGSGSASKQKIGSRSPNDADPRKNGFVFVLGDYGVDTVSGSGACVCRKMQVTDSILNRASWRNPSLSNSTEDNGEDIFTQWLNR